MEYFQSIERLAHTDKLNRLTGDGTNRQRSTTAGSAIELGQDNTGQIEALIERAGHINRILTCHGVRHQQKFLRLQAVANPLQFLREGVVNVQTTGGIKYQCIVTLTVGKLTCQPTDHNRNLNSATIEKRNSHLATKGVKLHNRCRAINVGRSH